MKFWRFTLLARWRSRKSVVDFVEDCVCCGTTFYRTKKTECVISNLQNENKNKKNVLTLNPKCTVHLPSFKVCDKHTKIDTQKWFFELIHILDSKIHFCVYSIEFCPCILDTLCTKTNVMNMNVMNVMNVMNFFFYLVWIWNTKLTKLNCTRFYLAYKTTIEVESKYFFCKLFKF